MAAKRGGLGKGLDSLIPASSKTVKPAEKTETKKEVEVVEKVVEKADL